MATPVIMPKLGMAQETATVVEWLKQEGDRIEKDEPILTVETDKATVEIEAPASGILAGICVEPDQVVPVTEVIAHILQPGEQLPEELSRAARAPSPVPPPAPPAPVVTATPIAQRLAAAHDVDLSTVVGTGVSGRIMKADVEAVLSAPSAVEVLPQKVRATPAARRIAREQNVNLENITGSGSRGRIQAADVVGASFKPVPTELDFEIVPFKGMRRTIAERMTLSYQSAPHITLTVEADMSAVQVLRSELNARAETMGGPRIPVTAILVKVCAWALIRHRWVNASLHGDEIHLHKSAHIGVAVALKEGLIVTVIHSAEQLGLAEIAAQLSDLAQRAQQGTLAPQDVSGGTFTLSNLGMYGIRQFTAILNPPQSAILAVGSIVKRQVVIGQEGQDTAVIRPMMTLTLSADHRVLDGAVAARFLQDVVDVLEHPNLLLW
jgi:pyruvate dehydrogenase E2 component (dihydrolipoamide acetyltransferase)